MTTPNPYRPTPGSQYSPTGPYVEQPAETRAEPWDVPAPGQAIAAIAVGWSLTAIMVTYFVVVGWLIATGRW